MTTVSLQEESTQLPELIHILSPGDVVVITENNKPIATASNVSGNSCRQP